LGHGGWKDAPLDYHKIGNCPHGLPIFAPWHREYLRQFEASIQFHKPGLKIPYIDWLLLVERGLPKYFLDAEVYGDYQEISEENFNRRMKKVNLAVNDVVNLQALSSILSLPKQAINSSQVQTIIRTYDMPFNLSFFNSSNPDFTDSSISIVRNYIDNTIIPALQKFVSNEFNFVSNPKKNPMHSSYNIVLKRESQRYMHDYTSEKDYVGSYKYWSLKNYNIDYQLAYTLHSSSYEQASFIESTTSTNTDNWGRNGI